MKNITLIFALAVGLIFFMGCDKDFEEINSNPNDPVAVPSGLLIADVVFNAGNSLYSTFVGGDMGSCWAQHWGKVQYNDEERYQPRGSVIETLIWKTYFEDVISDAKTMQTLAEEEGNDNMKGVALVMQAYGFSVLTDMFGEIPFSEAIRADEGIFSPKYDTQEEVYNGILALLDEADASFSADGGDINSNSDILYHGDYSKWQKFANSLKFRCLMRISGKVNVATQLQALMSRPMFDSNSDEAKLMYLANDPSANPIYETIVFGNRAEFKVNEVMVDMMADLNDPRLPVYAQPNTDGEYRGKPAGIENVPNEDYNYNNVSPVGSFYLQPTAAGFFLSHSELKFLMAEAAHKGLISGSADSYYQQGVSASFAANGLSQAAADAYLAQGTVAYTSATGLQKIAEQNWLGLYCQGVEAWTEWRRTGYPALEPAIEAVIDEIPSRYTYPAIEQSVNKANYDAAVSRQGSDLLTTKVWWMN
ncbi:MAG: SusD/RagB family nutrient-binding outer membrane lipoprotein [Sphingobacteriales bacterium]|nr:MAG: SusD/RagB family nutrient-binding outer membrane lipoprotein [Sphingobacteriales bacterium]